MGRFVSGTGGIPRRKMVTLHASNAAVEVPSWAQGGKGRVLITGCAPGGSGGVGSLDNATAAGAGAGAFSVNHPMMIPSAITSVAVVIGSPGASVSASGVSGVSGNNGGDTSVTVGGLTLTLGGGLGSSNSGSPQSTGGIPRIGTITGVNNISSGTVGPLLSSDYGSSGSMAATLFSGASGAGGVNYSRGHGGQSPWGGGGQGVSAVTGKVNGANATGYGAGGAGGTTYGTAGAATSGAGSPSFITLIFEEGF